MGDPTHRSFEGDGELCRHWKDDAEMERSASQMTSSPGRERCRLLLTLGLERPVACPSVVSTPELRSFEQQLIPKEEPAVRDHKESIEESCLEGGPSGERDERCL